MRLTMIALVASSTTMAHAQGIGAPDPSYAPPDVPPDIIAPERPRCAASAHCAAHCGDTTRTAFNRNTASDDARAGGTHTTRAKSADRMVQTGGKCESAAVPQCRVTASATMTRLTMIVFGLPFSCSGDHRVRCVQS